MDYKEKYNKNASGECNDTALEEQLKIWFEKGKCSGIDDVIFHPQKYGLEKQGQKYTWSEENEKMLDEIIDFFENGTVKLQHDLSLYASWLKRIKNRVIPQQKQESDGTEIAPPIDSDVCG